MFNNLQKVSIEVNSINIRDISYNVTWYGSIYKLLNDNDY